MSARIITNRVTEDMVGCRITVPARQVDDALSNIWPENVECKRWNNRNSGRRHNPQRDHDEKADAARGRSRSRQRVSRAPSRSRSRLRGVQASSRSRSRSTHRGRGTMEMPRNRSRSQSRHRNGSRAYITYGFDNDNNHPVYGRASQANDNDYWWHRSDDADWEDDDYDNDDRYHNERYERSDRWQRYNH